MVLHADVTDAPFSQPEGAVMSHTEALQVWKSSLNQTWTCWKCFPLTENVMLSLPGGAAAAPGSTDAAPPPRTVNPVPLRSARLHRPSRGEATTAGGPGSAAGSAPGKTTELPGI